MSNPTIVTANAFPSWETYGETAQVLLVEKNDRPLISFMIAFPFGSYGDPRSKEGLSNFMAHMLTRGTKNRTRNQIEETLDFLGASLEISSGSGSFVVEGEVLSKNITPFFDLVVEILTEPTFQEEEIEKQKKELLSQLQLKLESDSDLAKKAFMRAVYGDHPYGRDTMGTQDSIVKITQKDLLEHFSAYVHKDRMLIGAAGNISKKVFMAKVKQVFEKLPTGTYKKNDYPPTVKITGVNVTLVDKPDRSQCHFLIGHPSIHVNHPDYFALKVFLNAFAGPMFQAQYMQEIRVKRGWSYGAYGAIDARRDGGAFYLYTYPKTSDTVPAIKVSLDLLQTAVFGQGLSDESIEFVKNSMVRSFPFMIDLPEKVMSELLYNKLIGKPEGYLASYRSKITEVTVKMARNAAKKHLDHKNINIVVLCTAKEIEKQLKEELSPASFVVVPFDKKKT